MPILNLSLLQSWIPFQNYYFSFNGPSWSISDEMFFYVVFPFLLVLLTKLRVWGVVLFVGFVLTVYMLLIFATPDQYANALFYVNPLLRLVDFMIGMGVYYCWRKYHPHSPQNNTISTALPTNLKGANTFIEVLAVGFLAILIICSSSIPQIYKYACYYWAPMALIIYIFARQTGGGYLTRLLSWKPLLIAGEASFGFYMIHGLAIQVGQPTLTKLSLLTGITLSESIRFTIIFCTTLITSILVFRYFETPVNKWIKRRYNLYYNMHSNS